MATNISDDRLSGARFLPRLALSRPGLPAQLWLFPRSHDAGRNDGNGRNISACEFVGDTVAIGIGVNPKTVSRLR